jgi:hypothetical protein
VHQKNGAINEHLPINSNTAIYYIKKKIKAFGVDRKAI